MEAIIRTNDRNTFNSLVQFLKTLHFEVETREETKTRIIGIKTQKQNIRFNSLCLKTKGIKFNRDEANER